ncbi:MAG: CapA family protein [Minisyncoccia bacterium]
MGDYSPIIRFSDHPDTKFYRVLDYINQKTNYLWRDVRVFFRPRTSLTLKESLIFVGALSLFILVSSGIFSFILSFKKDYPSVLNFGDVMLDRGVRSIIEKYERDPFEYIKRDKVVLQKYDMVIANLEGPIVEMERSKCQQKIYNFQFSENTPNLLLSAGIKMVNIANNHTYDCLSKGYVSTLKNLEEKGVLYIGQNAIDKSYVIKTIDKKKIAFVGIDETIMPIPIAKFYDLVKKLKSENDYVVVNIHWGTEYLLTANEKQKDIGHKLVDNGADVVFGHHPHVVEPVEVYKNKLIFYSLGNFVFDQDFGDTTVGIGAGVEFQKNKMVVNILPFNLKKFRPEFMRDPEKSQYCDKLLSNIDNVGCNFEIKH